MWDFGKSTRGERYDPGSLHHIPRSIYSKKKDEVIQMKYQVQVYSNFEDSPAVMVRDACLVCHFAGMRFSDGTKKEHRCTNCGGFYFS